jgi:hypothetical protein
MKRLTKKHMTKADAVAEFKREVIPEIQELEHKRGHKGKVSKTTLGSAWVMYIDQLERGGYISEEQAEDWDNPFNR